ncbi:MAG: hypothetical protein ABIK83_14045 [Candidatus Zixiibacteriota bacterium]
MDLRRDRGGGTNITLGPEIARGGEASIYRVDGQANTIAKIYFAPRKEYDRKVSWMVDHPPGNPTATLGHTSIAWPSDLLHDGAGSFVGYLMPYIIKAVSLFEVFTPRIRAQILPDFSLRYLLRAAINLASSVEAVHECGYVIGDLNESNVLVAPSALVTLIDTDSFQISEEHSLGGMVYRCPVAKVEYTPPELLNAPQAKNVIREPFHDCFSLAVLIFQLMRDGSHPFRGKWSQSGDPPSLEEKIAKGLFPYVSPPGPVRPPDNQSALSTLHPSITELFNRCFIEGHASPSRRPTPKEWHNALLEAERMLRECKKSHWFSSHLSQCPDCQRAGVTAKSAQPPPAASSITARQPQSQQGPPAVQMTPGMSWDDAVMFMAQVTLWNPDLLGMPAEPHRTVIPPLQREHFLHGLGDFFNAQARFGKTSGVFFADVDRARRQEEKRLVELDYENFFKTVEAAAKNTIILNRKYSRLLGRMKILEKFISSPKQQSQKKLSKSDLLSPRISVQLFQKLRNRAKESPIEILIELEKFIVSEKAAYDKAFFGRVFGLYRTRQSHFTSLSTGHSHHVTIDKVSIKEIEIELATVRKKATAWLSRHPIFKLEEVVRRLQ